MKLGVLQTGHVPEDLVARFGEYPPMFEALLRPVIPSLAIETVDLTAGQRPEGVAACEGWLITGSKYGVYDPEPWIAPLEVFLREAYGAGVPIVGVCFGHQILAEAMGGATVKSSKGWGAGVHRYEILPGPTWAEADLGDSFAAHAMHQDQVVRVPEAAQVIARSEFCEVAALAYGDPAAPTAISVQAHPEFEADYETELVKRRYEAMGADRAEAALASIGQPVDNAAVAHWIAGFLRQARERRAAA